MAGRAAAAGSRGFIYSRVEYYLDYMYRNWIPKFYPRAAAPPAPRPGHALSVGAHAPPFTFTAP